MNSCKRKRVRKNPDGSLNQEDLQHNQRCVDINMFSDNPWMLKKHLKRKSVKRKSSGKRRSPKRKASKKKKSPKRKASKKRSRKRR